MKHVTQTPWTDEERAMLRRLRQNGVGLKACATMMGRTYHSVTRQVRYLGLQMRVEAPPKRTPEPPKRVRGGSSLPPLPSLAEGQDPHR
jgi:hypothetical protein